MLEGYKNRSAIKRFVGAGLAAVGTDEDIVAGGNHACAAAVAVGKKRILNLLESKTGLWKHVGHS